MTTSESDYPASDFISNNTDESETRKSQEANAMRTTRMNLTQEWIKEIQDCYSAARTQTDFARRYLLQSSLLSEEDSNLRKNLIKHSYSADYIDYVLNCYAENQLSEFRNSFSSELPMASTKRNSLDSADFQLNAGKLLWGETQHIIKPAINSDNDGVFRDSDCCNSSDFEITFDGAITEDMFKDNYVSPSRGSLKNLDDDDLNDLNVELMFKPASTKLNDSFEYFSSDDGSIIFEYINSDDNGGIFVYSKGDSLHQEDSNCDLIEEIDQKVFQESALFFDLDEGSNSSNFAVKVPDCNRVDMKTLNDKWNKEMNGSNEKPNTPVKVSFADNLTKVHLYEQDYEIVEDEISSLSALADRMRFQRRIDELAQILSPFLTLDYRKKVISRISLLQ